MKRFACHRLYVPGGTVFRHCIVCVADDGCYAGTLPLEGERAAVEWVGGVCVACPEGVVPLPQSTVTEVCRGFLGAKEGRCWVWKACRIPVGAEHTPVGVWHRLC